MVCALNAASNIGIAIASGSVYSGRVFDKQVFIHDKNSHNSWVLSGRLMLKQTLQVQVIAICYLLTQ